MTKTDSPHTLSQALAQKIRELLATRRWSQREFAQHLGVTQGAVSYLLANKRRGTGLDYYERLARVFGVPLSALIRDLEQRQGKPPQDWVFPMAAMRMRVEALRQWEADLPVENGFANALAYALDYIETLEAKYRDERQCRLMGLPLGEKPYHVFKPASGAGTGEGQ